MHGKRRSPFRGEKKPNVGVSNWVMNKISYKNNKWTNRINQSIDNEFK